MKNVNLLLLAAKQDTLHVILWRPTWGRKCV